MRTFDPSAAARPGSGAYGLSIRPDEARVVLVPVPFEATTSYRRGTARGPSAILSASRQVDLFDLETGRAYEAGIAMLPEPAEVLAWDAQAIVAAAPIVAAGGVDPSRPEMLAAAERVDALGEKINAHVFGAVAGLLAKGKLACTVGGDHSIAFGAIQAHAKKFPGMGILHLDAHADLRVAYEGFAWSHASIMENVFRRVPEVAKIVQVGIRDLSEEEHALIRGSNGRLVTFFDAELASARARGATFASQLERVVEELPEQVYLSFDIDGLDPSLCPHTGTPVPGGLSFHEASMLVAAVSKSGRRIVGLDLTEVAPGPDGDEWDANVGARLLYKMIGWALASERGR